MTQIPRENLIEDVDSLLPPSFQKRETSVIKTSPVTVGLDVCFVCAESTLNKKNKKMN